MNYKEAVIAAVKYGETVPVLVNGKRVKISVAEKPKESPGPAKAVTKKRAQTPKKAAPSTKKHRAPSAKTTKALPAKPPEAAEAAAAGSAGAEAQAAEPESGSGGDGRTEPVAAAPTQHSGAAEPAPAPEPPAQAPEAAVADAAAGHEAVAEQEAPRAAVKSEEPPAPGAKDWILHQNSTSHIESCRQLRQQYPDWNPESYSSKRNASERKENQTPKRRSGSGSRSPSPRRSRGSGSSSARRRSRSRSRSPGRYWPTRPRCWSPRPMRRPSPRHRSRSPQRSRNPLRSSPRPRRSASNDWAARRPSGSQDRKPSLETVVKTLRPDFVAEITKHKMLQAAGSGPSGSGKAPRSQPLAGKKPLKTRVSSKTVKKGVTAIAGSSSSPPETDDLPQSQEEDEEEEEASPGAGGAHPAADNRLLSEELLSFGTVLQISDLPDNGFTDQDIKNIFQPFGKVSDILVLRSRNEAFLEMNYKEAVVAAVEYGKTVPVLVNGKRVKISVAEKPKESPGPAKAVTKKRAQTPKKAAPSTKKHRTPATKTTKPLPAKPPEAAEAAAAGSAGAEAQAAEPESGSGGDGRTEPVAAAPTQHSGAAEPAPAPEPPAQAPEAAVADAAAGHEAVAEQEAPRAAVKSEEPPAPGAKEPDDTCVVLISNLPEKGYSVEEIFNLAKPFGGLRDVLILSSHKKAYLEINRTSADSMVKFYTCFAISLEGSQLCISMVPQFQTIKDEEAIFATLIKDSDPKVDTETIHKQFVHLGNLPDDGYRELEVVCVGLRFGRVDHYVILKNKNKAILQLDSPGSALSMHSSLQHQPYVMGEHTLTCALSPRGHAAQAEVVKTEAKEAEPSRGSSGFKTDPEASGAVQTAAAPPPAEPSVAKQGPASPCPSAEEASALQTEPSESRRDGAATAAAPAPAPAAAEKVDAGAEAAVASVRPAAAESSQARSEAALPPPSAEKEEAVKDRPEPALFEPAAVSASEEDVEEQDKAFSAPALGSAGLSAAGGDEDVPSVGLAAGEPTGAVPAALPPEPDAPAVEMAPAGAAQTNQLGAPEKDTVCDAVKTEQEIPVIAVTEKKPVLQTGAATEEQLDVAGAAAELKAEEPVPTVGRAAEENPQELLVKTEAETEKKLENSVNKVDTAMEDAPNAVSENDEGGSTKAHQSKGTGAAKTDETRKAVTLNSSLSIKDSSCVGKTILKAVVYLPDISKSRCPAWRNQPCLWKGGEQKTPSKPETRSQTALARRAASKEEAPPRAGRGRASRSCVAAAKGGNGRNSSQQEKEPRAGSKPAQDGESRICSGKKDAGSTKVSVAGNAKPAKGGSSGVNQKEEEKLFPFNLDEFVTVDEVVEETEPPVRPRRNPPRAKRKAAARPQPSCEPPAKRRRARSCAGRAAERPPAFLTLDETEEEEEEVTAQLMAVANLEALSELQGLVVVDEVMEEEEPLSEAVKDPQALVTLDELSEQDEPGSQKDVPGSAFEEPDLKAEPLVTVDEIGEVEELPLNEPAGLSAEDAAKHKEDEKGDPADTSSQVPDDPSALVTVDEIQEDADDNPLVTLDEVNEDEDDFLADFNRLKEELNFVTVDEVGEEDKEEENPFPAKNLSRGEEDEDVVAAAGPEEMGVVGETRPEVVPANAKPRALPGPAEA